MEVISIEARTYESMMKRFQATAQRVAALRKRSESKELKEWLDRQLPFFCTILFCPFFNCFSTLTDIQWQQLFVWQTVCLLRVCPRFLAILI
ncbi:MULTISPECIES: hypothetical protein [Bacteroides]|uniref:hypothetical protein n=1 Tax=Bacteroides TaxID=816 RepID=UPI001C37E33A|nr:hypothetical protein [Bacteroides cellulosilyticus]MBV3636504.1 hypothetical protein [Bacteroides cellulosilyticus]MBV3662819.1 hypothetical protein [Bacteroides cellulosilyticus]MBV3685097.1 hypothetical protein [Bacteroides cellulosilyticus]MBV3693506.1 hypothetical protein [Bacteroides cellulosilyticus]MBV3706993.1 hypothetical protein [Bacteroides cellulosilyticus]